MLKLNQTVNTKEKVRLKSVSVCKVLLPIIPLTETRL